MKSAASIAFVLVLMVLPVSAQPRGTVEATIEGDPLIRLLPKDGIPSIDNPEMIPASEAGALMRDDEPVIGIFDGKNARAYPTWYLDGHEIVNDRIGQLPVAATW